jgi:hypothetical protein
LFHANVTLVLLATPAAVATVPETATAIYATNSRMSS